MSNTTDVITYKWCEEERPETAQCYKCKEQRSWSEFNKNKDHRWGYNTTSIPCKTCRLKARNERVENRRLEKEAKAVAKAERMERRRLEKEAREIEKDRRRAEKEAKKSARQSEGEDDEKLRKYKLLTRIQEFDSMGILKTKDFSINSDEKDLITEVCRMEELQSTENKKRNPRKFHGRRRSEDSSSGSSSGSSNKKTIRELYRHVQQQNKLIESLMAKLD